MAVDVFRGESASESNDPRNIGPISISPDLDDRLRIFVTNRPTLCKLCTTVDYKHPSRSTYM
jgi:hypothetical protein